MADLTFAFTLMSIPVSLILVLAGAWWALRK
jgi:hypothetical protein